MPATILTFARRQPAPTEPAASPPRRLMGCRKRRSPRLLVPALPTPRQIAHRWAMLAHLKRIDGEAPPGTVTMRAWTGFQVH